MIESFGSCYLQLIWRSAAASETATPETGIEEDGEHAAGDEVPPQPGAREPPGDVSAGEEEFADAGAGASIQLSKILVVEPLARMLPPLRRAQN